MSENKFQLFEPEVIDTKDIKKPQKQENSLSLKDKYHWIFPLAFFLIGLVGLQVFSLIVSQILLSTSLVNDMATLNAYNNFITYVLTFITMLVVFIFANKKAQTFNSVLLSFKKGSTYALSAATYMMSMIILSLYSLITTLIYKYTSLEPNVNANQSSLQYVMDAQPVITYITVVFLGPFVEEMAYRLGLFELVRRKNTVLAFIISGLVFGLLHFDFANCFIDPTTKEFAFQATYFLNEIINLPSYVISGLVFAYAYNLTGTLTVPLLAHMINNFIAATMMLLPQQSGEITSLIGKFIWKI